MSKFLYYQDFHISGKNSAHYISNYFEDCLEMWDEVLEIAKEEKVDGILDGGDMLHTAEPSYRILDEIADRTEKAKINVYSLLGNHAERYHSLEHSRYTGMMHLIKRSKYFHYMDFFDNHSEEMKAEGYRIGFIEYSHDVEEEMKKKPYDFGNGDFWKILITHAFVCPSIFPFASHVTCDQFKTNADIVLVAHYHKEWEKQVDNTVFKDIGCLGRRSITERDIKPSVLLIDTDKREMKEINLKSAKLGEEIFDVSKVEEIKAKENGIEDFIRSVEDVQFQEMSIKDTVKFIAKEKEFTKDPVDLILRKMGDLK